MPKKSVTITVDQGLLDRIETDRGLAPISTYINRLLETIYAEDASTLEDIQIYKRMMGYRNTPETIGHLIEEALEANRKDIQKARNVLPTNDE